MDKQQKMYVVKANITTMFLSDKTDASELDSQARDFLREEMKYNAWGLKPEVTEATSKDQIPEEWKGYALLWGTDDEITPCEFLNLSAEEVKKDMEEFNTYLKLKAKYEE